jgi:tetratricopeptide (TPR) repeat protein
VSSPKKAIRIGRLLVAEWPNEAIAHYFLGNILRCNHRLGASIESYDKALKIDPSFIEALNNKGLSLNELEMFEVAVPVLMRALALAPSDPDVILNLAHAYTMSGQFSLARRMAKRFIHRTKAEPRGYRLLANIEADAGNLYLATEIFQQSLAIYPSDIPTIRDFCVLLMELKRFPEAIDLLQRGLKVAPDNNEFAAESMELLTQMGL